MRSFSIEGGGGAAAGDTGAVESERAFPRAGLELGEIFGVTVAGAPVEVPVPTTAIVPGTSNWKTPVYLFEGKSVRGNHRAGSNKYPPSLPI